MKTAQIKSAISDMMLMRGIEKERLEKEIKHRLARDMAIYLVNEVIDTAIVSREYNQDYFKTGETIYEVRLNIITDEEVKEYNELKKFRDDMRRFVK